MTVRAHFTEQRGVVHVGPEERMDRGVGVGTTNKSLYYNRGWANVHLISVSQGPGIGFELCYLMVKTVD